MSQMWTWESIVMVRGREGKYRWSREFDERLQGLDKSSRGVQAEKAGIGNMRTGVANDEVYEGFGVKSVG